MWKDYSAEFIKRNKASSASIVAAAFISALFLSLLCGLFYNFWIYVSRVSRWRRATGRGELPVCVQMT